jgi:hypothetical protein
MSKMLCVDPKKRMSFAEFFAHSWIVAPEGSEGEGVPSLLKSVFIPNEKGVAVSQVIVKTG